MGTLSHHAMHAYAQPLMYRKASLSPDCTCTCTSSTRLLCTSLLWHAVTIRDVKMVGSSSGAMITAFSQAGVDITHVAQRGVDIMAQYSNNNRCVCACVRAGAGRPLRRWCL